MTSVENIFQASSRLKIKDESLIEEETTGNETGFVNAVTVWVNKPHVVNRRLCGSRIKLFEVVKRSRYADFDISARLLSLGLILYHSENHNVSENNPNDSGNVSESDTEKCCSADEITSLLELEVGDIAVIVREMLPKQPERHKNIPELIIFDKSEKSFCFYPLIFTGEENNEHLEVEYKFVLSENGKSRIQLTTNSKDLSCDSQRKLSQTWLQSQLLKKLARWSEEPKLKISLTSLKLVSLEEYSSLYSQLKNKYGLYFAKIWPEKTDPQKFVFEDVAIATYLLLIWKQDREKKGLVKKQSFVDLGCGNGLLVHILASEGHPGYGIDLRRRNIWDFYGPETVLKEATITPSSDSLFPDVDWLIGNHSDELTPWIPVMAAKSSYTCCYFVLPCCHYDFNCKFRHDKSTGGPAEEGQYRIYLNFVANVGQTCGFNVEEDMLRIPSTKRICFIGRSRTYDQQEETRVDKLRLEYIRTRCEQSSIGNGSKPDTVVNYNSVDNSVDQSSWISDFTPRDKVEVTRNCVSVRSETKETVILTVFKAILEADTGESSTGNDGKAGSDISLTLTERKAKTGGFSIGNGRQPHLAESSSGYGGKADSEDFSTEEVGCGETPKVNQAGSWESLSRNHRKPDTGDLSTENDEKAGPGESPIGNNEKAWRRGGSIPVGDVVKLFDKDLLLELKSECGGLQTLLRNSSHIFQVSSGLVQLRDFTKNDPFEGRKTRGKAEYKKDYFKTALCWFNEHHPDGCPRAAEKCMYAHGREELHDRPKKGKSR